MRIQSPRRLIGRALRWFIFEPPLPRPEWLDRNRVKPPLPPVTPDLERYLAIERDLVDVLLHGRMPPGPRRPSTPDVVQEVAQPCR